jgi:hypothetical protein
MASNGMEGTAVESSGIEPIEKTGSTSDSTSFDELEDVVSAPKPQRKAIDNSESKVKTKEPGEGKDKPSKKASEKDDQNDNEEESNEVDDKQKQNDKSKEKSKEDSEKESSKLKSKSIKAKNGDQTIDLRSDAQFEVTVDGQKQSVTAQELLNEYSGKTNWNKKYQELDSERKSFETSKVELESGINNWVELTKSDPVAAIEYACEISGVDSRQMIQSIRAQFKQAFEEYATLTPEERKEREIIDERDYYKTKAEKIEADRANQRATSELDKRVKATIAEYGLDNPTYVSRYEELKQLQAQGVLKGELTPELVGKYHQQIGRYDSVGKILEETSPELEDKKAAASLLSDLWDKDPSLTPTDIRKIAVEVYGSDAAKRLSKKLKKSSPMQPTASRPRTQSNEPLFFDDLDS